jgi:ribosomal protein S18 acetylase RimI-like enzyme
MLNKENGVTIVELAKTDAYLIEISSKYSSTHYYDVSVIRSIESWRIKLIRKPFEVRLEKNYRGRFFEDHICEPRVFVAMLGKRQVGWIELGYDAWNNRMRVWEFLVQEEFRKQGIGTLLMNHGVKLAKERGARMLVLETQTNNANAIDFYMNFGLELIGFDIAAYSNEDTSKKEVRLELGLRLT